MKTIRPTRIVIVGAGFGGLYAYLTLHRKMHGTGSFKVTLINDSDRLAFIPMIHEVATGALLPASITQSLRTIPQCCIDRFLEGRATHIDFEKRVVSVTHGALAIRDEGDEIPATRECEVEYDYLVLANGSETNFFGVVGAREHAYELKSLADAKVLKNAIIETFARADRCHDPLEQKKIMTFAIVGGGPTGVEIAGELADMVVGELANAFPSLRGLPRILVIDRGTELVKGVDTWFGARAEAILKKKGPVYTMCETSVTAVREDGVETNKGFVPAGLVVWSAGVKAQEIPFSAEKPIEKEARTARIRVDDTLQIPSYPEAFVVGDAAWVYDREHDAPYPMRAQFAVREGKTAARNIMRLIKKETPLERFHFTEKGFILSLGQGGGLATFLGIRLSGPAAWVFYRAAYLFSIIGWRAKIRTALEWFLNLFLPRDVSKL